MKICPTCKKEHDSFYPQDICEECWIDLVDLPKALSFIETQKEQIKELRLALIDMVNQFAYEGKNGTISTGGLSSLEYAFDLLGLPRSSVSRKTLWGL